MRLDLLIHRGTFVISLCLVVGPALAAQTTSPGTMNGSVDAVQGGSPSASLLVDAPQPAADEQKKSDAQGSSTAQSGNISGTVTDAQGDLVTDVTVVLEGPISKDRQSVAVNDSGFFNFAGVKPGVPYHVTISGVGFEKWTSQPIVLSAGQFLELTEIKLTLTGEASSVTVYSTTEQIATQQVEIAEQQRVFGFIPNFYVVYDAKNAVPLTKKLKFQLAYKTAIDPVSIFGAAFLAAINQAADRPGYQQGWKGYGQRFGQEYADGVTDIMIGGAILPSLLHQDPRYFYQGTGTIKSRTLHAMSYAFVCKGDNGKLQPNYSTIGGDIASSAISNLYYPESDRGWGPTLESFGISTAERVAASLFQEFVVRKLTPSARRSNSSEN
jgi:Carboxypeptidase regulatory-like domain